MESIIRIEELEQDIENVKFKLGACKSFETRHSLLNLLSILRTSLNEENSYFSLKSKVEHGR